MSESIDSKLLLKKKKQTKKWWLFIVFLVLHNKCEISLDNTHSPYSIIDDISDFKFELSLVIETMKY